MDIASIGDRWSFLLTTAANELFPGVKIEVLHSLSSGGYFCEVSNRDNFTTEELQAIYRRMREIVAEDVTHHAPAYATETRRGRSLPSAGDDDKVRLLEYREKDYLTVYTLRGNVDYFFWLHGSNSWRSYPVRSARRTAGVHLAVSASGIATDTHTLQRVHQLESVFMLTERWLDVMGIEDVGQLNQRDCWRSLREEVLIAERVADTLSE